MKLHIDQSSSPEDGYYGSHDVMEFDIDDDDLESQRNDIKEAVKKLYDDLDWIYDTLGIYFEDECVQCSTRLINGKCIRCENFYNGYEREYRNNEILAQWREMNIIKIYKRDGLAGILDINHELPTGVCRSCTIPVPIDEWYKYAPIILCESCSKTHEAETKRAVLNRGQP